MLIPSIDLLGGAIVAMVQGEKRALDFTDFEPWLKKFEKYPMVQVVDLDAAMRQGSNREIVNTLCKRLHCQVGGGISSVEIAKDILAAGAKRVIIGSALFDGNRVNTEFAARLANEIGPKKLVFAVDAKGGKIAVSGWKVSLAITALDAIKELEPYCNAFLYTHIDTEGMLVGFPTMTARDLRAATKKQLILAGGIRSMDEVAEFDAMDADAVVGMAIYSGVMEA